MTTGIEGEVVVITGASSGLGEAAARRLAKDGAKLVLGAMRHLGYSEDAVSASFEEIAPADWTEKVYKRDIIDGPGKLYKRPGYGTL